MEYLGSQVVYELNTRTQLDGKVECTLKYTEKRTSDYQKWEERVINLRTIDTSAERAKASANIILNTQMTKCNFDLFSVKQEDLIHD